MVCQFVPSFAGRTAIATHTREVAHIVKGMGWHSELFVGAARDVGSTVVTPVERFAPPRHGRAWLLYQLSIGHPMADLLAARPEPLIVNYHNITPASLVRSWEPQGVAEIEEGRGDLHRLAPRTALGVGVSPFNESELVAAGYPVTTTAPVVVDYDALGSTEDRRVGDRLRRQRDAGGASWLFVGRVAPHKAQHRLVAALATYRELYDPQARLHLVGAASSARYRNAVERYAAMLGVADAVTVTGSLPQAALVAHYRSADVFVSASQHEGFGIPLLEAMWHGVPVVALAAAAVPETVAEGGVLLAPDPRGQAAPAATAAAVHRVLADDRLRAALVERGRRRVADFAVDRTREQMRAALADVIRP